MAIFKHTVKFVLQQTSESTKPTPLRCFVRYNNTRSVFPSGIVIEPRYWNMKAQEPRQSAAYAGGKKTSKQLKEVRESISIAFDHLVEKYQEYPQPDALKELAIEVLNNGGVLPGTDRKTSDLSAYMLQYIEDGKSGRRLPKRGQTYSPGTLKGYATVHNILQRFAAHKRKQSFKFVDLDANFYQDFKEFCYRNENLSDNYFGTIIKFVKTCMTAAEEDGLHTNTYYKRFVKVAVDVDNVYLSTEQLDQMLAHDFSEEPRLEKARDLFLVGCWTGLRFSDFTNIKAGDIGTKHIDLKMQKTKKRVVVPITDQLRSIMQHYEGKTSNSLPPPISNVKLNLYIKEVAEKAGLTQRVELQKSKAGMSVHLDKPLHDLISTHTARRSFASNMFRAGIPAITIMKVTGHRTESSFMKYIKASPTEMADMMLEHLNRQAMKAVEG